MPIRINLKELFPSDGQAITVDKLNFNFNKLLELGIGLPGGIGLTGPEGSAGPIGLTGNQGQRGTYWYVGTGNPNSQTFTGVLNGDFYLDSTNDSIWQYNSTTSTWTLLVDLGAIVNNYLATAGSPFVRGFGPSSPDDDRYIVFSNHGNNNTDILQDVTLGNNSNNDILFLNNFNEKFTTVVNFPTNTNDEFNALQKIYIDATSGLPNTRYHLELGSLYAENVSYNANLSRLIENLKIRYTKESVFGAGYPASNGVSNISGNGYINISRFSLSIPETGFALADITYNGFFEFVAPKFNGGDATLGGSNLVQGNVYTRIGSREALGEIASYVSSDGILFSLDVAGTYGSIGLSYDYRNHILPSIQNLNYLMIDHSGPVEAIFLNKKTYQDNGSIEQLATSLPTVTSHIGVNVRPVMSIYGRMGIVSSGNVIHTISDFGGLVTTYGSTGSLNMFNIEDANNPKILRNWVTNGGQNGIYATSSTCDQGGEYVKLAGASDIAILGDYLYVVNNLSKGSLPNNGGFEVRLPFQIVKVDQNQAQYSQVSRIIAGYIPTNEIYLEAASKIKLYNNYAIVVSKNYETLLGQTGNSYNEGRIVAINVSSSEINSVGEFAPRIVANRGQAITNYLALEIIDDYAITLTYECGPGIGGDPYASADFLKVYMDVFDLSGLNPNILSNMAPTAQQTIKHIYSTRASVPFLSLVTPTLAQYNSLCSIDKQFGAITGDIENVYIAFKNTIQVYSLRTPYCFPDPYMGPPLPEYVGINPITSFNIATLYSNYSIADMKLIGKDLYILGKYLDIDGPGATSFIKYDVANPLSPIKIYETQLPDNGTSSAFTIIGKNAYFCTVDDASPVTESSLITLELDAIITGAAEIRSLRANRVDVIDNLAVGDSARIHNKLEVGQGGVFSNRIATKQLYGNIELVNAEYRPIKYTNYSGPVGPSIVSTMQQYSNETWFKWHSSANRYVSANEVLVKFDIVPENFDRILTWRAQINSQPLDPMMFCLALPFVPSFSPNSFDAGIFMGFTAGPNAGSNWKWFKTQYTKYDGDQYYIPAGVTLGVYMAILADTSLYAANECNWHDYRFYTQKVGLK